MSSQLESLCNILKISLHNLLLFAEFDALTGSKISCIEIGSPVVRMAYSPTSGHAVIAILEVCSTSQFTHSICMYILFLVRGWDAEL